MTGLAWLGRTLLLVLAGLATLSIIGAIAAIPDQAGTGGLPPGALPRPTAPAPSVVTDAAAPAGAIRPRPFGEGASPRSSAPAAAPDTGDGSAWLEPLTWALMALAGFLAAILVVLLRISAQLAARDP